MSMLCSDLDGNVIHQRSILQDIGGGEMEGKDYDYLIPVSTRLSACLNLWLICACCQVYPIKYTKWLYRPISWCVQYHGWMMATAFGVLFPLGMHTFPPLDCFLRIGSGCSFLSESKVFVYPTARWAPTYQPLVAALCSPWMLLSAEFMIGIAAILQAALIPRRCCAANYLQRDSTLANSIHCTFGCSDLGGPFHHSRWDHHDLKSHRPHMLHVLLPAEGSTSFLTTKNQCVVRVFCPCARLESDKAGRVSPLVSRAFAVKMSMGCLTTLLQNPEELVLLLFRSLLY